MERPNYSIIIIQNIRNTNNNMSSKQGFIYDIFRLQYRCRHQLKDYFLPDVQSHLRIKPNICIITRLKMVFVLNTCIIMEALLTTQSLSVDIAA